jgi:hypothetical protein
MLHTNASQPLGTITADATIFAYDAQLPLGGLLKQQLNAWSALTKTTQKILFT